MEKISVMLSVLSQGRWMFFPN